jgi:hypothetical protein
VNVSSDVLPAQPSLLTQQLHDGEVHFVHVLQIGSRRASFH